MAENKSPFENLSTMMTQSFEQTHTAMEKYFDLFKINMTASPLFTASDLTKKMQSYGEQNIAAASECAKKLMQARDFQEFWRVQTEYMQAQLNMFGEQTKDLSETLTKSATGALKDFTS